ncbi:hypothetical protein P168DRAFT_293302 [Aspergillus campestris IBT 28561]|uniref:Uncharacterized protein n=1 Tax=Aspergillus campestris (strain IBT 28561) TaxID=1392248 RepID=A0A2I1CTI2_ASPC2|nr:uncharacterized protein P168DRAFT_293302 [Aspergillus campestris IBT 28561]PKY00921.1 hypothetical protein P168DRAFT_293302 [Aspergillus campestris IBT 28561]
MSDMVDFEDGQSPPPMFKMRRSLSQIYQDLSPQVPEDEHFVMTRLFVQRDMVDELEEFPDQLDGGDDPEGSPEAAPSAPPWSDTASTAFDVVDHPEETSAPSWSDTASAASDEGPDGPTSKKSKTADDPTCVISHPSKIVDYHLYLRAVEKDKDTWCRRNGMYLYDGMECRRISYRELLDPKTLFPGDGGNEARFLICALPIPDHDTTVRSRHYVVGFNCTERMFFARHFDYITENIDDLWTVWDDGLDMYQLSVPDLLLLLQSSFRDEVHVGIGVLSSSPFCVALCGEDDPGMEIVIAISLCQWLLDFAEVIFEEQHDAMDMLKQEITHYVEELRMVLQRASFRAWFASNRDLSTGGYKRKSEVNKYINDLYNYEKSMHDGSLAGRPWRAPGLETCDRLRSEDRNLKRKRTEGRLEELFAIPETESSPEAAAAEAFEEMRERSEASRQVLESTFPPDPPRTPSPRPLPSSPGASARAWSPMSPGIVAPATEGFEEGSAVTEYDRIPLSLLLRRAADLVDAQPELDTVENRGGFARMLLELGVGIDRAPRDVFANVSPMGYLHDDWSLASGAEAPPVRRLLPSPAFD